MAFFDKLGGRASSGANGCYDPSRRSEINRLNAKMDSDMEEINKRYTKIGRAVKLHYMDSIHDPDIIQLAAEIDSLLAGLNQMKAQIDALKGIKYCPGCGSSLAADTLFCPNCGTKQPAPQPTVQPAAPAMPQTPPQAVQPAFQPAPAAAQPEVQPVITSEPEVIQPEVQPVITPEPEVVQPEEQPEIAPEPVIAPAIDVQSIPQPVVKPFEMPEAPSTKPMTAPESDPVIAETGPEPQPAPVPQEPKPVVQEAPARKFIFCTECGNKEDIGTRFCSQCGTRLDD